MMKRVSLFVILLMAVAIPGFSFAQSPITAEIAPTGKLRVGVSASSGALVTRTPDDKITGGLALELGKFISEKLSVPFELVSYPNADAFLKSFGKGEWDIGFGSSCASPLVSDKADFIADLLLNDYVYVAGPGREFADAAQVDRPGVKIGAGPNSVSDQFLSKNLKSAQLIPISTGDGGADVLRTGKVDIWATGASNVPRLIDRVPGAKMLPGAFTSERQAVCQPKGKSSAAQKRVAEIIMEAKKAGMVRKTIEQLDLVGVRAAPD
jgi:polar amino acid transport system substrate-binding protein